jgi:hypothetical protein
VVSTLTADSIRIFGVLHFKQPPSY